MTTLAGPAWTGNAASIPVAIPNEAALAGVTLYVQGALAGSGRAGLTEAARLVLGRP